MNRLDEIVIVAGMHRSGTSATMRVLDRLGFITGDPADHVPVAGSNSYGHFELQAVVDFNDRLLDLVGSHWAAPTCGGGAVEALATGSVGDEARELVASLGVGPGWAVKDPRFCLTIAFWRKVLAPTSLRLVVPTRSPVQVAASLLARNGFATPVGEALWLRYHEALLASAGPVPVVVVDYESLVSSPDASIKALSASLGIDATDTALAQAAAAVDVSVSTRSAVSLSSRPSIRSAIESIQESLGSHKNGPLGTNEPCADLNDFFAPADAVVSQERIRRDSFVTATQVIAEAESDRDRARHHFLVASAARDRLQSELDEERRQRAEAEARRDELVQVLDSVEADRDRAVDELRAFQESRAGRAVQQYWGARNRLRGVAEPSPSLGPVNLVFPSTPIVSVVVPVHDQAELTAQCLRSLAQHQSSHAFEVIVVDDASNSETANFLSSCSGIELVTNSTNLGFTRATNLGASKARGDFILLLNNDTELVDGCLDALVARIATSEQIGAVCAKLVYPDGTLQEAGTIIFNDATGWNFGKGQDAADWRYEFPRPVDYGSAAALLVRRSSWQELGGFDERYAPAYYEDSDLCFGLRQAGLSTWYEPRAVVVHHEGASHGTDLRVGLKATQVRNRERFAEKWADTLVGQPSPQATPQAVAWRGGPRVLVFDAEVPAPDQDSGSVRMHAFLTILNDLGYRVTFFPHNRFFREPYATELADLGIEVGHGWDEWRDLIELYADELAAVIVSRPSVAAELVPMITERAPNAALVYDMVDFHGLRLERRSALDADTDLRHAAAISELERAMVRAADVTVAVTEDEAQVISELEPGATVRVVPNIHRINRSMVPFAERSGVMFVGSWRHPPNRDAITWLMDDVMPKVWAEHPEIHLHLVGSDMPTDVAEASMSNVTVHGWVQDLDPLFDRIRLSVAPLRFGAGMKGKIGDSLARGVPVVTTPVGAEGFGTVADSLRVAESANDLSAALVDLYFDQDRWIEAADAGCSAIETELGMGRARERVVEVMAAAESMLIRAVDE